jgi:hypothetical protein
MNDVVAASCGGLDHHQLEVEKGSPSIDGWTKGATEIRIGYLNNRFIDWELSSIMRASIISRSIVEGISDGVEHQATTRKTSLRSALSW